MYADDESIMWNMIAWGYTFLHDLSCIECQIHRKFWIESPEALVGDIKEK